MAKSNVSLTPPRAWPLNHPVLPVECEGVKQILWSPASAAVKVKRPVDEPFWETTRWSLSNTSCENKLIAAWLGEGTLKGEGKVMGGETYVDGDEDV
jgi:hypothetical protein